MNFEKQKGKSQLNCDVDFRFLAPQYVQISKYIIFFERAMDVNLFTSNGGY